MTSTTKKILTAIIAIALIAVIVLLVVFLNQKNGFYFEGDDVYYYENGEMAIGWKTIKQAHTDEDGNAVYSNYYFDADGKMHKGWFNTGDDWFYFRKGDSTKKDIGGQLVISQSATMTLDGKVGDTVIENVFWYIVFSENGRVASYVLDVEKYSENKMELPEGDIVPIFAED